MRKVIGWSVVGYLLFALFMTWYLFYGANTLIPAELKGTAADPETFLNARELLLTEEYSQIRNLLFFLNIPLEWMIYLFILVLGISAKFRNWSKVTSKISVLQTATYLFWLSLIVMIVTFPLRYIGYTLSKQYNITTQAFPSWMKDVLIDFWVNYAMMLVIVTVLYWLIRKSTKRWWLYAWLASIPFSLFLMFVQPVIIDPLYNDFYPLKDKELETKILALADEANIPSEHVYEVNMSEKTNALNAYVTGIGSNSRIVLWDTTLNRLDDDEILFIMAHEMGHYVMKHIYVGIAGYVLLTLVGLFIVHKLMAFCIRRYGSLLKVNDMKDIASLPLFLLLISVLTLASSPFSNAVSRYQEKTADTYAIEMTQNNEAAVQTFQELTKAGLSQVHPPLIVKLFRYGHPTMLERITFLENYEKNE